MGIHESNVITRTPIAVVEQTQATYEILKIAEVSNVKIERGELAVRALEKMSDLFDEMTKVLKTRKP